MQRFDAARTGTLLPIAPLIAAIRQAANDYANGQIASPERMVVPLKEGGIMLSMPAVTDDIAIHKLVNITPRNAQHGLPTIHGQVIACDARSGEMLFQVDGPTLTAKRTAAVSLLGIQTLSAHPPERIVLIGTGQQAAQHAKAIAELWPEMEITALGRSPQRSQHFVDRIKVHAPRLSVANNIDNADVIIALTTSQSPLYTSAARPERLVIGVGAFTPKMAEIHPDVIHASSVFVDDPHGAKHEAGDLIQAGVDWSTVHSLADALHTPPDLTDPIVFKTVGTAAWDLAACRVIRAQLGN